MANFDITVKQLTTSRMTVQDDDVEGSLAYIIRVYLETISNTKTIYSINVSTLEGKAVATIVHQA